MYILYKKLKKIKKKLMNIEKLEKIFFFSKKKNFRNNE
jgi:hypothetical protein